jgi:hypothetical protein
MKYNKGDNVIIMRLLNESKEDITDTYTDEPYVTFFKRKTVLYIERISEDEDYPIHVKSVDGKECNLMEDEIMSASWKDRYTTTQ